MILKRSFILLFVLAMSACTNKSQHPIQFYYWKSTVEMGETEKRIFTELDAQKLYIRLFDVDKKSGNPQPQGIIHTFDAEILNAQYIPVIYITNRTFKQTSASEIENLAHQINNLVNSLTKKSKMGSFQEIQIDCDWTVSTQKSYFDFLKTLKNISGKKVTCTLRLHQVKYKEKTGVPPVNKVYLMCYATSSPLKDSKKNSILDMGLLKNYLETINDYPLDFDVALPLYSWAIATNHIGRKKLINGVTEAQLQPKNFKKTGKYQYQVLHELFLSGLHLNKGFWVKIEAISPSLLQEAKEFLDQKIDQSYNIIYYHLDADFLRRYSLTDLK